MSLQANVVTEGDILVVQFTGRIDVESAPPFRMACRNHLRGRKVVFDFSKMNFVGSAGILPFLEAMQEFSFDHPASLKFCGVGIEFRRVLAATSLANVEIYEIWSQAVDAFINPQVAIAVPLIVDAPVVTAIGPESDGPTYGVLSLRYEADERDAGRGDSSDD